MQFPAKFILDPTYVLIVCERGNNGRGKKIYTDKSISVSVNSDDIQFIG